MKIRHLGSVQLTETSMAIPVQSVLAAVPRDDNIAYETTAPIGVAALNIATCFLQSVRGSEVANKDVVRAKAVGAENDRNFRKSFELVANNCSTFVLLKKGLISQGLRENV